VRISSAETHARAGLIGNPSDGFHGATISLIVANFTARVVVYEWPELEVLPAAEDRCRFASLDDFLVDVHANGYEGGMRLVKAAIKRFADHCRDRGIELCARTFSVRYESTIPRQVGLAGSSAIVTATLRALCDFHHVAIDDADLPNLALSVETDELGIPAGLQDRVAQVYGGLVFMDFDRDHMRAHGHGLYEPLDPALLPPLYVAYRQDAAERSAVFHSDIRRRYERGEPDVVDAMRRLAELARAGRACLLRGDHAELASLIDSGFEVRRGIYELDPRHVRMVELARELGASATFAGSGGAIVGSCRDSDMRRALRERLAAEACAVIEPRVA
jgi:glucuronokinase